MSRMYNIFLDCGCMISLEGGGGLMPCYYLESDVSDEKIQKHKTAWEKYRKSPEYIEHQKEIEILNSR